MNDKRTSTDYRLSDLPQVNSGAEARPAINVPSPMDADGLSDSPVLQNAESLPDDWFDFKPEAGESAEDAMREAAEGAMRGAADNAMRETAIANETPAQASADPQKPKRRGLKVAIVILLICLLAVAGAAYAFMSGLIPAGQTEEQPAQEQESSESVAAVADKKVDAVVTINVKAEGYDRNATPIMYHVKGTASGNAGSSSASDPSASDSATSANADSLESASADSTQVEGYGEVDETLKVSLEGLPEGSYTITWSNSILSDGSFYRVPKEQKFTVSGSSVTHTANFEKVDGATADAEEVKAAYDSIDEWLKSATSSLKSQRDTILEKARLNASKAPSVMEAGGLDAIGNETDDQQDQLANQQQQDNAAQQQQQMNQQQTYTPVYDQTTDNADDTDDGDADDTDAGDSASADGDDAGASATASDASAGATNGDAGGSGAAADGGNDTGADTGAGADADAGDTGAGDAGAGDAAAGSGSSAQTDADTGGNDAGSNGDAGGDSSDVGGSYESTGDYE